MTQSNNQDRRAFPRRLASGAVVCRVGRWGLGKPLRGKLLNLSQMGARFTLSMAAKLGDNISLELLGVAGRTFGPLDAIVRRCEPAAEEGQFEIGCRFEKPLPYAELDRLGRA